MARASKHNKVKVEEDANEVIRRYIEADDVPPVQDQLEEGPKDVPWHDQATQDTREPAEAVISGGDIDAAWDQAAVGDETVGGSSPTPDQDIVDDIGKALGVTYQEGEPLRMTEKIEQRDIERWELNPASSEDLAERSRFPDKAEALDSPRLASKGAPSAKAKKPSKRKAA
jgi:Family of unknown function (DUF6335)